MQTAIETTETKSTARKKSKLTAHGDATKRAAMRALLLETLEAKDWSLAETARALDMTAASSVLAAIEDLGLQAEYKKAKKLGRIRPGRPPV